MVSRGGGPAPARAKTVDHSSFGGLVCILKWYATSIKGTSESQM